MKQRPAHNLAYIHSKPVVYVNNGGGRDTYIYRDDGGFTKMYDPANWPNVGSIQGKPTYKKAPANPVMHAKPVFYRANGGGRDSYIE